MKNLFYAVVVACSFVAIIMFTPPVKAESIASMPNKGGGKIVLTNEVCKLGNKVYSELNRAYNYTSEGYGSEGCFMIEDDTVVIVWNLNGKAQKMRYPLDDFSLTNKKARTYGT